MFPCICENANPQDIQTFYKIIKLYKLLELNSNDLPADTSCHSVCRAINKILKLKVIDGFFHTNFQHSWLITPNNSIIDPYPPLLIGGPILMPPSEFSYATLWEKIYRPAEININLQAINLCALKIYNLLTR